MPTRPLVASFGTFSHEATWGRTCVEVPRAPSAEREPRSPEGEKKETSSGTLLAISRPRSAGRGLRNKRDDNALRHQLPATHGGACGVEHNTTATAPVLDRNPIHVKIHGKNRGRGRFLPFTSSYNTSSGDAFPTLQHFSGVNSWQIRHLTLHVGVYLRVLHGHNRRRQRRKNEGASNSKRKGRRNEAHCTARS